MAKFRNKLYECSVICPRHEKGGAELMKDVLHGLGIHKNKIIEVKKFGEVILSFYFPTYQKARHFRSRLNRLHLKRVEVGIKPLKKRDWETQWQKDFTVIRLTENLDVVPSWRKKKYKPRNRKIIYLEPGLAFGTGQHVTTRFMAQFIEKCAGNVRSLLDIGAGSGILSLVALKNGIPEVTAVEYKRKAASIARGNLKSNGYPNVKVKNIDIYKFSSQVKYDFVAANLITHDLLELEDKLVALVNPGRYLAVSGISIHNFDKVHKSFQELPLRCLRIKKGEGWSAILYKRRR